MKYFKNGWQKIHYIKCPDCSRKIQFEINGYLNDKTFAIIFNGLWNSGQTYAFEFGFKKPSAKRKRG